MVLMIAFYERIFASQTVAQKRQREDTIRIPLAHMSYQHNGDIGRMFDALQARNNTRA
jgi:hypothetical protein